MKTIRYLLIFYAFFLILLAPILHVLGNIYGWQLISFEKYVIITGVFLLAILLYSKEDKELG